MSYEQKFMDEAIRLSIENIGQGGGPFGAVIVREGQEVAASGNSVTNDNDPTAHAEVNCIRQACRLLGTFDLSGCDIYSSCEPCPMCLSAIYWAGIDNLYYANTKDDAAEIGFSDSFIYDELRLDVSARRLKSEQHSRAKALEAFKRWAAKPDKTEY